jgi:hypothetical protein
MYWLEGDEKGNVYITIMHVIRLSILQGEQIVREGKASSKPPESGKRERAEISMSRIVTS